MRTGDGYTMSKTMIAVKVGVFGILSIVLIQLRAQRTVAMKESMGLRIIKKITEFYKLMEELG